MEIGQANEDKKDVEPIKQVNNVEVVKLKSAKVFVKLWTVFKTT